MESNKEKREEFKTYKSLSLGRNLKSKFRRDQIDRRRVNRVIGGGDRPFLEVNNQRYLSLRREVTKELLREAKAAGIDVPIEALMASLRHRIERVTYERLSLEQQAAARVEVAFVEHHGRHPTANERQRFVESALVGVEKARPTIGSNRGGLIDEVLGKIQNKLENNPARFQTAWAQVVGPDIAHQSQLDRVDAASGTAYFRCLNSALSYQLQRQTDLPKKLGKALGMAIRSVRVRH